MSFAAAKKEYFLKKSSTPDVPCDPAPSVMGAVVLLNPVYVTPPGNVPNTGFPPIPSVIDPVLGNGDEEEKEDEDEEDGEDEDEEGEDDQGDVVSPSPFKIADEMQRVSKGPSKVIASEIKMLVDVDECAEILSLLSLHFKYLKGEICACGVRLTHKYKELGACAGCSGPKNPVNKIFCINCKLVNLRGKWKEIGFCSSCFGAWRNATWGALKRVGRRSRLLNTISF